MRTLLATELVQRVSEMVMASSRHLPPDVLAALQKAHAREVSAPAKAVLEQLLENARYAAAVNLPLCQDTGAAVFFVEHGEGLRLSGGTLHESLTEATRTAYAQAFLRASICHPLSRANTGDNTPIFLHTELVPGEALRITFLPKGGGAENMSRCSVFPPAKGRDGVKDFVHETVRLAGPNPCPPLIVGVGIGGSFDSVPTMAKQSLLRPLDEENPDPEAAALEAELLEELNALPIGAGGMGGNNTCLGVRVLLRPCHIASLPVAVNIQCNSARRGVVVL